jgi:hypothetical protein
VESQDLVKKLSGVWESFTSTVREHLDRAAFVRAEHRLGEVRDGLRDLRGRLQFERDRLAQEVLRSAHVTRKLAYSRFGQAELAKLLKRWESSEFTPS